MRTSAFFQMVALAALAGIATPALAKARSQPATRFDAARALKARLPRTQVAKLDCSRIAGLCEVQAGTNLFYIDRSARYLIIGRVYDMETRQDLTAARLLEISPDTMLAGAASVLASGEASLTAEAHGRPMQTAAAASAPAMPQRVSLAGLPASGAIEWGGSGPRVTVFSDFHCGYCRMLHQTLKGMGVHVTERPISVLGTRAISDAVICAEDKSGAVDKAYSDLEVAKRACDTSGLDANERFAQEHGFTGTPVIVREDGAVVLGFRPREFLEAWLKGGA